MQLRELYIYSHFINIILCQILLQFHCALNSYNYISRIHPERNAKISLYFNLIENLCKKYLFLINYKHVQTQIFHLYNR